MATYLEHENRDSHELATRDRLLLIVLLVATAVTVYLVYRLLRPFLPSLAWALALSIIALPVQRWMSRRIHHRGAAAGLTVGL
ncbi:MAG TPA: hypothetical protein VJ809_01075, partial [Pirellulales bacterium]|nr:hypothetical protein [Pirellulales bacterium]